MSLENLSKLVPDGWQGPKELMRIVSNLLWALAILQLAGFDFSRVRLSPPTHWGVTLLLAGLTWAVVNWMSSEQERVKREEQRQQHDERERKLEELLEQYGCLKAPTCTVRDKPEPAHPEPIAADGVPG